MTQSCANHPDRKIKAKGLCGSCYHRHLDEVADPQVLAERLERRREKKRLANKTLHQKRPQRHIKHRYGISPEQYAKMFEDQDNRCGSCGEETKLVVDHNHETGKVRQLICNRCNQIAGAIEDPRFNLVNEYLKKHNG